MTILFADVVGSTSTVEKLDPEDARDLMGQFFSLMAGEIRALGGHVDAYIGDAILAFFGIPSAHDDDPVRAVDAALRMIRRLEDWGCEHPDMPLRIRVGINTGEVLAGSDPEQDLPLTSDAVNVAARLQQLAQAGTILIGARTARSVDDRFLLEALGPQDIKGKAQPLDVWRVMGARRPVASLAKAPVPMIGREREMHALDRALDQVIEDRHALIVTLVGDPGVGKSRVIEEFADSVADRCGVVSGRCVGYGAGVTLGPLADILRAESGVLVEDDLDVVLEKIRMLDQRLFGRGANSSRIFAGLTATLGLDLTSGADGNAREVHEHLLFTWCALLSAFSSERPLIVIIEDVHWADALLLEVLGDLAQRVESPVLIVCSARPGFATDRPGWPAADLETSLRLDPLQDAETGALVDQLLGGAAVGALRDRILQRAEGNPFFVEQITRGLIDEAGDSGAQVGQVMELVIPDNVQSVILSRIDLLPSTTRRLLQEAAVIGRGFRVATLHALSDERDARPRLDELEARELIVKSDDPGEPDYVFKHSLVRDVAYQTLPRRVRATMHERVGRWLKRVSGTRSDEYVELMAHHFHRAHEVTGDESLRAEARAAYMASARKAQRSFAIREAGRFGSAAVELSSPGPERIEALEALGDIYYMTFEGDSAWKMFCEALGDLDRLDSRRPEVEARLAAKAALIATRFAGALQQEVPTERITTLIARGLAAAGPGDSRERCMLLMSQAGLWVSDHERVSGDAAGSAREAVRIAESLNDADLVSATLDIAGGVFLVEGRFREMRPLGEQRIALEGRITDPRELGDALGMAAWAAHNSGDFFSAEAYSSRCLEATRGLDVGGYVHALAWRICARFMLGRWAGVLEDQDDLDRLKAEDGRDLPVPYALRGYACTALCHELRGERDGSIRYLSILEGALAHGIHRGAFEPTLARLYAHLGMHDKAFALIAIETGGHSGCPDEVRTARLEALADLILLAQRWDMAEEALEQARSEIERVRSASLPAFADRLDGAAAFARGDSPAGQLLLARSVATFDGLGARWHAAWSRLWLGRLMWEAASSEADVLLAGSLVTFDELGSVTELAVARALVERSASRAS
ncbi:MAG: AAA family ATPase [Actinomycetota bacterium]